MVRAYPTDEQGNRNGESRSFSDLQWKNLNSIGKHRWVIVTNEKPCVTVELLKEDSGVTFEQFNIEDEDLPKEEEEEEPKYISNKKRKRVTKNKNNE